MTAPKKSTLAKRLLPEGSETYYRHYKAPKPKWVYIAGPMRGYEKWNFPAFDAGRDYVNSLTGDFVAISPADMDRALGFDEDAEHALEQGSGFSIEECMRRDLKVVANCHAILLLRGWQNSTGANNELFVAKACGVEVWEGWYEYDQNGQVISGHIVQGPELAIPMLRATVINHVVVDHFDPLSDKNVLRPNGVETEEISLELDQNPLYHPTDPGWPLSVEDAMSDVSGRHKLPPTPAPEPDPEDEETILEEANLLIFGPRNADYGHPFDDFTRTGKIWGAIIGDLTDGEPVPPEKVGLMMAGLKISREINKHKRDNLTDIAGYTGTVAMISKYRKEKNLPREF